MVTLHNAAETTRKIGKWLGIITGVIIIGVLIFRVGNFVVRTFFPKPPPPPNVAFGKLPALVFPNNASSDQFSFQLDTVSGGLGTFSDRAKIFKTVTPEPNLLDLQRTRESVTATPFKSDETFITDTIYSWRDFTHPDKKLTINIVSKDFTISSNYFTYPDLTPEDILNQTIAVSAVQNFLKNFNLYPLDIDENKIAQQLLSVQGTSLFAATSLSTAQLVRIDLFQQDIDKLPVMYPRPPYSTMHFLMGGRETNEIMEAKFNHQIISKESTTYPLISVEKAYDILKSNKAYIASYYGTAKDITIKNVYLAYYIGEQKQDYVMPIYVFEGKEGFNAYVSAIEPQWIR